MTGVGGVLGRVRGAARQGSPLKTEVMNVCWDLGGWEGVPSRSLEDPEGTPAFPGSVHVSRR